MTTDDEEPIGSETAEESSEGTPESPPPSARRRFFENVRGWGLAILVIVLVRTFIFEPYRIPSTSMVPTLLIGDHVFVTKFSYGLWLRDPWWGFGYYELLDLYDPERGDVIVFLHPEREVNYIKRVVGIPGDEIQVIDNQIYVNGVPQEQQPMGDYTYQDYRGAECVDVTAKLHEERLGTVEHQGLTGPRAGGLRNSPPVRVPEGKVFVMGDNRDNSEDGRQRFVSQRGLGFVDEQYIKGKAHFIWLSWDSCAEDAGSSIRTDRLFKSL